MFSLIQKMFQPPVFDDPEKNRRAKNLHIILLGLLVATLFWAVYPIFIQGGAQIAVALIILGIEIGLYFLIKRGNINLAGNLISLLLWFALVGFMASFGGVRNSGFATFSVIVVIASLTLGARAGIFYALITIIAGIGLVFAENQGILPSYVFEPGWTIVISHGFNLIGVSFLLFLTIQNINTAMKKAVENEKAQKENNALLEASQFELQQRTSVLEQRNATLQTATEVSRLTSQVRNERELLERSVELLAENIKLEHVAIFLLDQMEENAILWTSNSSEGKLQITDGYLLKVAHSETAYLLSERDLLHYKIGDHNYYIDLPNQLPAMETSVSFPMASGNHLLGLLNIQTLSPDPRHIDLQTLQTFVDQIALSVENIRLLDQLQSRVREVDLLAGQTVRNAWEQFRGGETIGYHYNRLQVQPSEEKLPAKIKEQLLAGRAITYVTTEGTSRSRLIAPILLRGNVIGIVGYDGNDPLHEWSEDDKTLLEAISSRVSLALENTRLVADAQQRAERERTLGQITARMRETLDVDTILKTAAKEMRQSFDLSQAEVRLQMFTQNE